jgi:deoxyinosine 3'endonuclease (endonuclease V)
MDIPSSVNAVMGCLSVYRIPEPLRRADIMSRKLIRENNEDRRRRG